MEDNNLIISISLAVVLFIILSLITYLLVNSKLKSNAAFENDINDAFEANMLGGSKHHINNDNKYNPKVQIMLQNTFQLLDISKFWIMDKYDGVFKTYEDDSIKILYEELTPLNSDISYRFVFDIIKYNGKDITNESYDNRMKHNIPEGYIKKEYIKMDTKDDILFRLYDNKTDTVEFNGMIIPIDGLILQNDYESYKIKKSYLNTIDCKIHYESGRIILKNLNSDGKYYDKFINPFFDNNACYLSNEPILNDSISDRIKNEILEGYKFVNANINNLEDKYGEFTNVNGKWYFLRLREHANSTINAVKIASLIYNPLHTKEGYFNTVSKTPLIKAFHEMSHAIRYKVFNIIHNECPRANKMLDICCGRGGDIKYAKSIGIKSFVGIDSDKDSLCEYGLKAPFTSIVTHANINRGNILSLSKELNKRKAFSLCDICVIDFGIHYLSNCLSELGSFIKSLLLPDGKIFITYFDSDTIIKKAVAGKVKINDLTIEILENGNLNMPLPTISKDGHREEPMMNKQQISILGKKPKIYPLTIKKADAKGFENICEYTKFIKLAVISPLKTEV